MLISPRQLIEVSQPNRTIYRLGIVARGMNITTDEVRDRRNEQCEHSYLYNIMLCNTILCIT